MRRDERAFLFDMLESARVVQGYFRGKTIDDFSADLLLQDAVIAAQDDMAPLITALERCLPHSGS